MGTGGSKFATLGRLFRCQVALQIVGSPLALTVAL
jgi:hypothetical protein